ncbi:MAG TPA: hypothetical protein VGS08_01295 [Candidatus Saccharimonadales bacterium]|nr:hypothetical protein [Candidatus Saccharimonadales bacterium]
MKDSDLTPDIVDISTELALYDLFTDPDRTPYNILWDRFTRQDPRAAKALLAFAILNSQGDPIVRDAMLSAGVRVASLYRSMVRQEACVKSSIQ